MSAWAKAAGADAPMVQASRLTKTYAIHASSVEALRAVDLFIRAGEDIAVVGPSGSGKSTFMNLVGGLDRPTTGDLVVAGQDLSQLDNESLARFRNRTVGFVFQQFNLLPGMTALDNVAVPLLYRGMPRAERRDRAAAILTRLGLSDRLDHRPTQLSGGQQQRVAIARALVGEPRLLLADEPTGSLDSSTSAEILTVLRALCAKGLTLVIVTHDAEVARGAGRRIGFRDGLVVTDDGAAVIRAPAPSGP